MDMWSTNISPSYYHNKFREHKMTSRRAFHYTWRAMVTFLIVSLPGLIPQIVITGLLSAWLWANGDGGGRPSVETVGLVSSARAIASLWVYLALIFVFFKYAPEAIAEVLANRNPDPGEESTS